MKSSSFPSVRVDPELRQAAEDVLQQGESLSSFVEQSIRLQVQRRHLQQEFVARGLKSRDAAKKSGKYYSADQILGELDELLATARSQRNK